MRNNILSSVDEAVAVIEFLKEEVSLKFIEKAAEILIQSLQQGGKILVAGNGGSLCDAMHFAEELSGQFRSKRKALAAIALADPGHMSCVANDFGFNQVFARGVEALGKEGDVLVSLTTSGNSQNIVEAIKVANKIGLKTITFLGKEGGVLKGQSDVEWIVKGFGFSDRIQEAHMAAIHIIIEMVEKPFLVHERDLLLCH